MWGHYLQQKILDAVHAQDTITFDDTVYVALSSTLGDPDGTGWTEPTIGTNGYARLSLQQSTRLARTDEEVSNSNSESFAESSGAWLSGASLPYFSVWTASSAGSLLWGGTLATARQVAGSGVTLTIAAGELTSRADAA
jgi:hypothetical protein